MRSASRLVLLSAGWLCAWAAAGASAEAAPAPASAAPAPTDAARVPEPRLPPEFDLSGCEPDEVRARLTRATEAEVSRACGNISFPWAFRGRSGRRLALRDFGRHRPGAEWTKAVAGMLLDTPVDTAFLVPSVQSECKPMTGLPIYLIRFEGPGRPTFAVVRFDLSLVQLFDAELPLGMIALGERADSLWGAIAQAIDDDPLLRKPRPAVAPADSSARLHGDAERVDVLPEVVERFAPNYPEEARRTNVEGTVFVRVRVGPEGTVTDAFVVGGPAMLRDPSLEAVWQWRFKPAQREGRAISVWVMVPVKFTLE